MSDQETPLNSNSAGYYVGGTEGKAPLGQKPLQYIKNPTFGQGLTPPSPSVPTAPDMRTSSISGIPSAGHYEGAEDPHEYTGKAKALKFVPRETYAADAAASKEEGKGDRSLG